MKSLYFCDEILVFDMGSTDGSLEIARSLADRVTSIPRVQYPEIILHELANTARNEWILNQDPDEVFPVELISEIQEKMETNARIGKFELPLHFFFKGKLLEGTVWGKVHYKDRFFNRERVFISPLVHQEIKVKDGFETVRINCEENNFIRHYWVDSYSALFEKHWRYIKAEGQARFSSGKRFSFIKSAGVTFRAFTDNILKYHSLQDGFTGLFLSFFYAWYVGMSELSLLFYQLSRSRSKQISETGFDHS